MRKLMTALQTVGTVAFGVALAGATLVAQTPPAQDGFRAATPEDLAAGQEHLPATPLVFWAYGIVWLVLVLYVISLWRRIAKAERDVADVSARLEGQG